MLRCTNADKGYSPENLKCPSNIPKQTERVVSSEM